ncbi:alpha/beta fold hydrolase [Geitlerinema sp. PCC 7407]|uniref:alpha/beta fold hydrolase n=1 Tax=Geitlerinema sp. PCC 7407 TaxID=1173025 RepID=UPI00029FB6AE|nr:alpha/beta hydrolase [Geitlerinema sp. PCC 7407]AFY68262.1 alpha/beta hydrolase fold protein [Geitlerinema sp. PCC 7407]
MTAAIALHHGSAGSGFPVLCLHGHPGSGASLSVFTGHLSRRFCTIAPDLRGYGKSRVETPFQMADHLADLEALLDAQNIQRCLVLGWSLGGILALELALRLPQRVSGLILVATAARPRGNHPPITWQDNVYTGLASLINLAQPGAQWHIQTFGQRSLYRYLLQRHTPTAYEYLAREGTPAFLQTSRSAQQALTAALRQRYNRLSDLSQIQCPALIMAGSCDRHITPEASYETAQHLPHSTWQLYEDVAHLFPWEIPDRVLQDIDHWLDRHPHVVKAIA